MGVVKSTCSVTKDAMLSLCKGKERTNVAGYKGIKRAYGAAAGGQYDDSDDERSSLYGNNKLCLDDDDEEEEQIVIITNTAKKEQASQRQGLKAIAQPKIDQSMFKEGKGLLDLASPARPKADQQKIAHDRVAQMEQQMEQDRQVNEMMNEIDDHIDDDNSDDEDTSYLVSAQASVGGTDKQPGSPQATIDDGSLAHSYYPEQKESYQSNHNYNDNNNYADNQNYNAADDYNYNNQYNNSIPEQDYQKYAQPAYDDHTSNNAAYNQSTSQGGGAWDQQWQENNGATHQQTDQYAEDIMAELDQAADSDDDGLL